MSWGPRAAAYDALTRRHPLLGAVADRLLELVPADARVVLDVGAGAGLVSGKLLARDPAPAVHLTDPTAEMIALAKRRLGDRLASARELGAEELDADPTPVDAAVASACLHLSDPARSLPALAARVRAGGVVVFNLWSHAWAPTAGPADDDELWRTPLRAALVEAGRGDAVLPEPTTRGEPWQPEELSRLARAAGFEVDVLPPDQDPMDARFLLDFAAMNPELLRDLPERADVLARARELASGTTTAVSTRLTLRRRS